MKLKMISLLLLTTQFIVSCGGDKNETQVDDSMILAVRSLEGAEGLDEGERTQVALLSGNIATPEQAQLAAESAEWIPMDQFQQDEELAFVQPGTQPADMVTEMNHGRRDRRRGRGFRRQQRYERQWRPYRRHHNNWVNYQWVEPSFSYGCGSYRYVHYSNNCYVPYSSYYGNYYWQARYHYRVRVVYRGYGQRTRRWRGHARVRFYW